MNFRPAAAARQTRTDSPLRLERVLPVAGIAGLTIVGWLSLWLAVADMSHPLAGLMMPALPAWTAANAVAVFTMWWVMMTAMMLPSAAPMILLYAKIQEGAAGGTARLAVFVGGYLLAWGGFSAAAAAAQWALQAAGLITPMLESTGGRVTGALFLLAGLWQITPLKRACLTHCRSPLAFLMTEWREGLAGALRMGLKHGAVCVGCCWGLMILLFALGVMNLVWVAALAAVTLVEKVAPRGDVVGRLVGVALLALGAWALLAPLPGAPS